ncbi:hypothetical protein [Neobacillus sp. NPDC093127]|uniref:NrdR family transcriptional regulator n=1 Tax=Neobacillus sp. NPDC093127 TaxID=3364296 RepID=UPI0038257C3E
MICPKCKESHLRTVNSRNVKDTKRRRRECVSCGHRFTTIEVEEPVAGYYETLLQRVRELEHVFSSGKQGWAGAWQETEDKLLIKMYYENIPYKVIATNLNRTYKGIEMRIIKLRKAGKL